MSLPGHDRMTRMQGPHGWVQWKGTSVCMDVHCQCGVLTHIDTDYGYFIKCPACGKVYAVNGDVEFVALTPQEVTELDDHQIKEAFDSDA